MLTKPDLEESLRRVHEWIRSADEKVSIFLALQGVALTILFPKVFSWTEDNFDKFSCLDFFILLMGMVLIAISLCKSVFAIIPSLDKKKHKKSMTYFGDIAEFKLEDFQKMVEGASDKEYGEELINQIYISSGIAKKKHTQFREAITAFFGGIILLALSFFIFRI